MARVTVVSGGGTGIGRAVAAAFAADGDDVVIVGRRADVLDRAAKEIGDRVVPIAADLAEVDGAHRVAAAVRDRFGRVDVLVNNAGGAFGGNADDGPVAQRRHRRGRPTSGRTCSPPSCSPRR